MQYSLQMIVSYWEYLTPTDLDPLQRTCLPLDPTEAVPSPDPGRAPIQNLVSASEVHPEMVPTENIQYSTISYLQISKQCLYRDQEKNY